MITEQQKAWLAGIMDGEGSLNVYYNKAKIATPVFRLNLVNSNMAMMLEARTIMVELCGYDIPIKPKKYYKQSGFKTQAPMWVIETNKKANVVAILSAISPYMIAKKDRANFFLYWVRKSYPRRWTQGEIEDILSGDVETKRQAPIPIG